MVPVFSSISFEEHRESESRCNVRNVLIIIIGDDGLIEDSSAVDIRFGIMYG